jgi:hypothetical protein
MRAERLGARYQGAKSKACENFSTSESANGGGYVS